MSPELQEQLFEKYPDLLPERRTEAPRTPLDERGIECRDGWFNLIKSTLEVIFQGQKWNNVGKVKVTQIKEKFGHLNIYTSASRVLSNNTYVIGVLRMASNASFRVCEVCGNKAEFRDHVYRQSLCEMHNLEYLLEQDRKNQ